MGTDPITPIFDPGADCNLCKDVIFDGVTPLYVEAHVMGIEQCPAMREVPEDSVVILTQDTTCRWLLNGPPWTYVWDLIAGQSLFTITFAGQFAFQQIVAINCLSTFTNANIHCGFPVAGINGTVEVLWGPTIGD